MRGSSDIPRALAAIFAGLCVTLFVVTPLDLRTQFFLAGALIVAALVLGRSQDRLATLSLVLLSVATTGRYLWWRLGTTLSSDWSFDAVLSGILLASELYACAMLLLAYAQSIAGLRRKPVPMPHDLASWPSVDVFIPTYNEPLDVLRPTVTGALRVRGANEIFVLDDGNKPEVEAMARSNNVAADELLASAKSLLTRGYIRRYSAVVQPRKSGFAASAMGVWVVPEAAVDDAGAKMSQNKAVSHCYLRPVYDDWPYNLYTIVHGRSVDECESIINDIAADCGIREKQALYPTKEYKKARITLFSPEADEWEAAHGAMRAASAAS